MKQTRVFRCNFTKRDGINEVIRYLVIDTKACLKNILQKFKEHFK